MKRVDRFIIAELAPMFFMGVLAFTGLVLGAGAIYRIIRLAMDFHIGMLVVAELVGLKLPEVIAYTLPMATLFCILIGFNRLSNDLEVTAFRAAGVSFLRLVVPVLIMAFFVSIAGVLINDRVTPFCNKQYNSILKEAKFRAQHVQDDTNILVRFRQGDTERILYAQRLRGTHIDDVSFMEFSKGALKSSTSAREAEWAGDQWRFKDGTRTDFDESAAPRNVVKFRRMNIILNQSPGELKKRSENFDTGDLSIRQTREWIALMEKAGSKRSDIRKMMVDYHSRMSIPFAAFIFALVAAPLGLRPQRTGGTLGMGLTIIIIFVYYISQQLFRGLGQGFLDPALAAWLPNLLMMSVGGWLLAKSNR
jgi:lipopolysaccharide export system permease protein